MQAIININKKFLNSLDLNDLEANPLLIEIMGKTVLEYYCDFLAHLQVKKVYFQGDVFLEVEEILKQNVLERFEFEIVSSDYKVVILDEPYLSLRNLGFILDSYFLVKNVFENSNGMNLLVEDGSFSIELVNEASNRNGIKMPEIKIQKLENMADYMDINFKILESDLTHDYLVGYENKDKVILGRNVNLSKECTIIPPVVLLDNVNINKACTIGPNVVLNSDVYIEEENTISSTIVYKKIHIGKNLKFKDKLVFSKGIMDRFEKKVFNIDEQFISKNRDLLEEVFNNK